MGLLEENGWESEAGGPLRDGAFPTFQTIIFLTSQRTRLHITKLKLHETVLTLNVCCLLISFSFYFFF